ncbi:MAG: hypothetical protein AB8H12_06465, partial [Lewinella sp.]
VGSVQEDSTNSRTRKANRFFIAEDYVGTINVDFQWSGDHVVVELYLPRVKGRKASFYPGLGMVV